MKNIFIFVLSNCLFHFFMRGNVWLLSEDKEHFVDSGEEALVYAPDDWETSYFVVDGIALLPIVGVLRPESSWRNSTANIGRMIDMAKADENVRAVLLYVQSPGGNAALIDSVATKIHELASVKPVEAFAREAGSGGYWLVSQADYITVEADAGYKDFGSIGAFTVVESIAEQLKMEGIDMKVIRATKSKDKAQGLSVEPLSEAFLASMKAELDDLLDNYFIPAVKRGRGKKIVENEAGEPFTGASYTAQQAIDFGLVDKIGTLQTAYDKLKKKVNKPSQNTYGFFQSMNAKIKALIEKMTGKTLAVTQVQVDAKPQPVTVQEEGGETENEQALLALVEHIQGIETKVTALSKDKEDLAKQLEKTQKELKILDEKPADTPTTAQNDAPTGDLLAGGTTKVVYEMNPYMQVIQQARANLDRISKY